MSAIASSFQPAITTFRNLHRIGAILVVCVFPLIWLGATVTTYAAGMAVPDWPGTYGYNMFLYPLSTWLFGPFNLLVEHGHRLLASVSGLITIALVIAAYRQQTPQWIRRFAVLLLVMIIVQGALGGLRVLLDARTVARLHGCVGPFFFALLVAFCVVTSRWWIDQRPRATTTASSFSRFALGMLILSYLQLCIGSFVRHVTLDGAPTGFRHVVFLHFGVACLLALGTLWHWICSFRSKNVAAGLRGSLNWLMLLTFVQIGLGLSTYVVKYGWPNWFVNWELAANFVIEQKSMLQANIITGHVAVGSLIIAFWTVHFLRCHRVLGPAAFAPHFVTDQGDASAERNPVFS